jgi:7-keto-8-aminopelargonate synthetase-like enzyme
MAKITPQVDLAQQSIGNMLTHGIGILTVTDEQLQGRTIQIKGAPPEGAINFGNCSYLGLELDPRLKQGAIDAVQRFGIQFSSSRAYAGIQLYEQLEEVLEQNFGLPVLVTVTTTLGHLSAIPVLIGPKDAIILDQRVHNSVQMATQVVKADGTHVEYVRHNNMERLEARIQELSKQHPHVWYMADGVYSMHGDVAPAQQIVDLLNRYENFHCYIDDAHGFGWTGKKGCGQIVSEVDLHPRMILAASMGKGFGCNGGFLVCPDVQTKQKIRYGGATMLFSAPVVPAVLGACLAAAKLMQTDELPQLQMALQERIQYFIRTAKSLGLPLVNEERTPIFLIRVGIPDLSYKICHRLIRAGFYTNMALYPGVPYNQTGVRIGVTLHHSFEDIQNLLCELARLMEDEGILQAVQPKDVQRT